MNILNFRKLLVKSLKSTVAVTARLVKRYVYTSDKVYAANLKNAKYDSPTFGEMPVVNFSTDAPVAYKVKNRSNFAGFMRGIKCLFDDMDKNVQIYDLDEYPCLADNTTPRYPTVFEAIFNETVGDGVCPFEKEAGPEGVTVRLRPATGFTAKNGKWDYYGAEVMGVSTEVNSSPVQFYVYPNGDVLDLVAPVDATISLNALELTFTLPGFKSSTCSLPAFPTVFSAMFNEEIGENDTPLEAAGTADTGYDLTLQPASGFTKKTGTSGVYYGSSSVTISSTISDVKYVFDVTVTDNKLNLKFKENETATLTGATVDFSADGYTTSSLTLS